jgi:hypothetical protein
VGTLARTETVWSRNADGTIRAQQTAVTNAAGSTTTTTRDADGDGDADTVITDTHDFALGQRTVAVTNQDGSLRTQEYSQTWSDGLTTIRSSDIDGNGSYDHHSMDTKVVAGDGTVTRTVTDYAGNNATKLAREVTVQSADRLTTAVTRDSNGDGFTDSVTSSVTAADGSSGVTQTNYFADGSVASATVSTVSANGLVATTTTDLNGDAIADVVTVDTTTLNLDGSRVHSVRTINGDGSDRNLTVSTQAMTGWQKRKATAMVMARSSAFRRHHRSERKWRHHSRRPALLCNCSVRRVEVSTMSAASTSSRCGDLI